jgi:hypothetical protein
MPKHMLNIEGMPVTWKEVMVGRHVLKLKAQHMGIRKSLRMFETIDRKMFILPHVATAATFDTRAYFSVESHNS